MKLLELSSKTIYQVIKGRLAIKTFIILSLFISCSSKKKITNIPNPNYQKLTKEFVKNFKSDDSLYFLSENTIPFEYFNEDCIVEFKNDTITFTKNEKKYISDQFKRNRLKKWSNNLITNAKIVNSDTITNLFKIKNPNNWDIFRKRYGKDLYSYSAPIFFKNNSYCIFYFNKRCGNLCGFGGFVVYKKVNNKWQSIKTYCAWIS